MSTKHKIKRKPNYEILIIPDVAGGNVKKYNLTWIGRVMIATILAIGLIVWASYIGYTNYHRVRFEQSEEAYRDRIAQLEEDNRELENQVANQENTIHILSTTVNKKVEAEAEYTAEVEEKKIPDGFPLSGTIVLPQQKDEVLMPDGLQGQKVTRPLYEFSVENGTLVIATGDGTVSEVSAEATYGYQVVINHENGYETVYRAAAEPNINVGDNIPKGGTIYVLMGDDDEGMLLGYQIRYNEEYVDPGTVLKIEG